MNDQSTSPDAGRVPADASGPPGTVAVAARLLPLIAVVFVVFFVVGMALPIMPLYVHSGLGFGASAVGLVSGSRFAASFIARFMGGAYGDRHGAKRAVLVGLVLAPVAGVLYIAAILPALSPTASMAILLAGRFILGAAESFVIMGIMSWGIALVGTAHAGKALAWVGIAMYAAYACSAPAGTALYGLHGFSSIAVATLIVPILGLAIAWPVRAVAPPTAPAKAPLRVIAGAVWLPGLGLALTRCTPGHSALASTSRPLATAAWV